MSKTLIILKLICFKLYDIELVICSFFVFFIVGSSKVSGQYLAQQTVSLENDSLLSYNKTKDTLWSNMLFNHKISDDGSWVSMTINYKHKEDTLILANIHGKHTIEIPGGRWDIFSDDSNWHACYGKQQSVWLTDLKSKNTKQYPNIINHNFTKSSRYWLILHELTGNKSTKSILKIKDLNSGYIKALEGNVLKIAVHPINNIVAISREFKNENQVILYHIDTETYKILASHPTNKWHALTWSENGQVLVFMENNKNSEGSKNNIYAYTLRGNGKLVTLSHSSIKQLMDIEGSLGNELQIADNGTTVALHWISPVEDNSSREIEIWQTDDQWLYPRYQVYQQFEKSKHSIVWQPFKKNLFKISSDELPTVIWNVNHTYALQFDKLQYEPQYKLYQYVDLYITHTQTGKRKKILEKQYNGTGFISVSPTGRHIAYFKDKNWWVFDTDTYKHTNLTQNLPVAFEDETFDQSGEIPPYGNPGWTPDDKEIILYDRYDIWKMKPDGSVPIRITAGRTKKLRYRIAKASRGKMSLLSYPEFNTYEYTLQKGVFLSIYSENHAMGYVYREPKGFLTPIVWQDKQIDRLLISKDHNDLVYRKQDYHESPEIVAVNRVNNSERILFQTNRGLTHYDLGKSELIHYQTKEGDTLRGVLIYPSGYDPGKKYPMVVNIYEKMSYKLHRFNPSSNYQFTGFNAMKLATAGYAVLFPDIQYKEQAPGISALNCVTAAVEKVIDMGVANPKAIGLIGHSFGGYETAFIITQTDLFATAIAGGAITDFWTYYWNMGWNRGMPDLWRFENHQFRMGRSILEIPQEYLNNSPIHHIEDVQTPVLLWTGKEDKQVNWQQSVSFYLALRKLGKEATLILYPEEKHNLMNPENQKHLTQTIQQWFDKHLNND